MENGREKQIIYVKDLIFRALYQWKLILVAALAFAVLLGAFGLLKDGQNVTVGGLNVTPQTEEKIEQLEMSYARYEELAEKQREYIVSSPYMAIDPYAVYTCGFHLYPKPNYDAPITEATPVEQDTDVLLRAYRSLLSNTSTFELLTQEFDYDIQNLRDQITFETSTEGALGICIYGRDPEEIQKLSDALQAVVLAQEATIVRDVQAHSLKVIPFQSGPAYNLGLADIQNAAYQRLKTYENELLSIKTELDRYKPTQLVAESGNPLLYAIVGAVLGAFLVVCFVWVVHLCSDKVYSSRVLVNRTGVRVLGCTESSKKRNFIDRWLRKLEGRSGNQEAALAADIRNRCRDCKSLLIMGSFCADSLSGMIAALQQAGIDCKVCQTKTEAMEALPGCDSVVLAQTCGDATYAQVEWAMQTAGDYEKKLIGCVLIDG